MQNVVIFDGYVDEPSCLGVPPYISPYPRYIAGSIWSVDSSINIQYLTIDHIRNDPSIFSLLNSVDLIIVIAGVSVPGRYLSTFPMSPNEALHIFSKINNPLKILTGPAAQSGFGSHGGKKPRKTQSYQEIFDAIITGDSEIVIHDFITKNDHIDTISSSLKRKNAHQINEFAIKGSKIVSQHPNYPNRLLCEIETYRGCSRSIVGGCLFCSEPQKGQPDFRPIHDIVSEIKALYDHQIRHIRLGNQPCIFSYMSKDAHTQEFPTPNPSAIYELFSSIRKNAPELKTFHIDNANPGVIARHPDESIQIAKHIINFHSSGDVAAFGVESVDPIVIEENNLKANADQVLLAIRIINEVGAKKGRNGLPELLPGLNFLYGLPGERKQTFSLNLDFLKKIIKENLLLRRINIRQVIPLPYTSVNNKLLRKNNRKHHSLFIKFKEKVAKEIDKPMLEKTIPKGSILKDVIVEQKKGKIYFGRQMGSYPLLIGIVGSFSLHDRLDVTIIDHGYRSLTAVQYPLNINTASLNTLEALPMIGKKRAMRLIRNRPFSSAEEIISVFDDKDIGKKLIEIISFTT